MVSPLSFQEIRFSLQAGGTFDLMPWIDLSCTRLLEGTFHLTVLTVSLHYAMQGSFASFHEQPRCRLVIALIDALR